MTSFGPLLQATESDEAHTTTFNNSPKSGPSSTDAGAHWAEASIKMILTSELLPKGTEVQAGLTFRHISLTQGVLASPANP